MTLYVIKKCHAGCGQPAEWYNGTAADGETVLCSMCLRKELGADLYTWRGRWRRWWQGWWRMWRLS